MVNIIWTVECLIVWSNQKRERNHNYKWERKFKCDYCDYTFDTIGSLRKCFNNSCDTMAELRLVLSNISQHMLCCLVFQSFAPVILRLKKKSQYATTQPLDRASYY